jgi:hypothetical protein
MSIVALSVVTTLLVQHFSAPTPVAAQAGAQREVRAQLFLLVGPSGNTLARLGPGGLGNGNLELRDTSGTIRADFAGDAVAHLWDANSNLLWQAP